jgi:hypothetical protein
MAEITATYEGKILTDGSSSYVSPPIVSEHSIQGSRDYQVYMVVPYTPVRYTTAVLIWIPSKNT